MADTICIAEERHKAWLMSRDKWVDESWIGRCIRLGEYLIAERDHEPAGFVRWSWFWGKVPYMDMIRVEPALQRSGIGTLLLGHLQDIAVSQGAQIIMTSCESDEQEPLNWYRKQGFAPTGDIAIPTIQTARETFLVKHL
ncbi:MAG: GNAT family N-acetyltransferase [Pseudomonadota bacterium]